MSDKFKQYMNEAYTKPVWETYKEIEAFDKMLEEFLKYQEGKVQSGGYADRMDRREHDSIQAAKNFILNVKEIRKHIDFLRKNMKEYHGRDLEIGR